MAILTMLSVQQSQSHDAYVILLKQITIHYNCGNKLFKNIHIKQGLDLIFVLVLAMA